MKEFSNKQSDSGLFSASIILKALWEMLIPNSILEVGVRDVHWQLVAREFGTKDWLGVWDSEIGGECINDEFNAPIQCSIELEDWRTLLPPKKQFDLVISLNVANCLSVERSPFFIEALCDGTDLVLFSGYEPRSIDTANANNQSPFDWSAVFSQHHFACFDVLRPKLWHTPGMEWQYLQNVLLFARRESTAFDALSQFGQPVSKPITVVHPNVYAREINIVENQKSELERIAFKNPFGRDNHIRMLENKIERLRSCQSQKADAYKNLSERYDAIVASRSWKFTAPFRSIIGWFGRDID